MAATTIHLIESQAELTPYNTAICFRDTKISYFELNRMANKLAGFLASEGFGIGNIIGISIDRSLELMISLLAVFKIGAAYVPLDPEYPNQRLEYMLKDSKADLLLINLRYKGELNTLTKTLFLEEIWSSLDKYANNYFTKVENIDLAYILYTSGTTGHPKGVMIEHKNLLNLIESIQKFPGMQSNDKLLSLTTMSFDISVLEFFLPLTVGATLYLSDSDLPKDGEAILRLIKQENISFMQATPSTYKMMLAAGWEEKCNMKLICCGEQLPKDLAEKILSKCARLFNMYGPTETTIYSSGKEILKEDLVITIGTPVDNTKILILDDHQHVMDGSEIGEICIAGDGLARGYLGKTSLTDEKFITIQQQNEIVRVYRTGDLGKILENGEIQCFGRIDHQIKIRGYRIETGEIEYMLLQEENITEALVTSWKGPSGDLRIAAYVVLNQPISDNEIPMESGKWRQSLRSSLPFYMIPNDFIFIDEFPLLDNGKINRNALPVPNINILKAVKDTIPRNPLEIMIAKVWAEKLGIDNIGIYDNFFDLGGHSLTAVKVIVQIKKLSGKYLPLGTLIKYPTIARLAEALANEINDISTKCLVPLKPGGSKPPLYIVHGLGSTVFKFYDLAHQLDADQPVFGFQAKGLDGLEQPAESIEDMASQYIKELLEYDSLGPYNLSGYSFGGIVAFEMSKQLKSLGKEVNILALFDSFLIEHEQMDAGIKRNLVKYLSRIKKFLFTFKLLVSRPKRTIDHKLFTIKRQLNTFLGRKIGNEVGLDDNFDQIGKMMSVHRHVKSTYRLKKQDLTIHLFKANINATYLDDFQYLGWKPFASQVIIHEIEGDHIEIFEPGINLRFAKSLQTLLNSTDSK